MMLQNMTHSRRPIPPWLVRLGRGGFAFFLAKGLLWLVLPALARILLP